MPEDKDLLNGDHSSKMWFSIMWRNSYIQFFFIALFAIGLVLYLFDQRGTEFYLAIAVPFLAAAIIAYKGFYQFWNDLKNGRSR